MCNCLLYCNLVDYFMYDLPVEIFAWNCSKFISLRHEGMVVTHAIRLWLRLVLLLGLGLLLGLLAT